MAKKVEERVRVTRTSAEIGDARVAALRELVPEAAGERGIDWERLRTAFGVVIDERPDRYRFEWAGKRDAIANLQQPSTATLVPVPKESINFDATHHVFIEGENLEVLKLLYKPYSGRVKMIYIDPPYNTGNDFIYRDDYSRPLEAYLEQTGQNEARPADSRDAAERAARTGRLHSDWLSMMYPRLFLARQLLRDDGVIFVSIDDHEVHHLRLLMNEIFGEENFLATFVRRRRMATGMRGEPVSPDHEYVVAYARFGPTVALFGQERRVEDYPYEDEQGRYRSTDLTVGMTREMRPKQWYAVTNPTSRAEYWPPDGRVWRFQPSVMSEHIRTGNIIWPEDLAESRMTRPRFKTRFDPGGEATVPISTWIDTKDEGDEDESCEVLVAGLNQEGTRELREVLGAQVLEYPKPVSLVAALVRLATRAEDIVLDFFAGSGTTAEAVVRCNEEDGGSRQFIIVQLPETTDPQSGARQAGFHTISAIGRERVRRVVTSLEQASSGQNDLYERHGDRGMAAYELAPSCFRAWVPTESPNAEGLIEALGLFADPLRDGWQPVDVITEVAIKEAGFGLNPRIEPLQAITTNTVYRVADRDRERHFHICLDDRLDPQTPKALGLHGDTDLFVCRDVAVDDTLAANLALQCRLRTI